jgi:hypothetical protein
MCTKVWGQPCRVGHVLASWALSLPASVMDGVIGYPSDFFFFSIQNTDVYTYIILVTCRSDRVCRGIPGIPCGSTTASTRTSGRTPMPAPRSLPRRTQLPPPGSHTAPEAAFIRSSRACARHTQLPRSDPIPLRSSLNCHGEKRGKGREGKGEEAEGERRAAWEGAR